MNLLLGHQDRRGLADAGLISPTSRCRFGDADADGYVPAEGAVTVILKPLADAVDAGDQIYATILGSGVTSNGKQAASAGGTGTTGQEDLLRIAFRDAGVNPADLDYIEAHGPGTPMGDAVELTALSRVLRDGRSAERRCLLGSAKSNIGHAEATAGLVGLLKTALAVRHRIIPATLHVREPNPVLLADDVPLELVRANRPWPDHGRPAIAGVTALGLFGAGAHVVLAEAPRSVAERPPAGSDSAHLLPLSTKDPSALRALASAYATTVTDSTRPADVCFSAGVHRTRLPHRTAVVAADRDALVGKLLRIADGHQPNVVSAGEWGQGPPRVVFVYSGQGSQWFGMGRDLLETSPVFARRMRECDEAVRAEGGWSPLGRLRGDQPLTADHEIQPTLWAIQVSLAEVWRHCGIEPDLVIGHSMGEVAAATTSGALTLRDGAAVICRRSLLTGTLDEPGAMVAVQLGEREANEAIGDAADQVSVAVINSAGATVLAGAAAALDEVVEPLRERGVFCRRVRAGYASHSPSVESLRAELLDSLADLCPRPGRIPMHSTALDREVRGDELGAEYWMANLREPVRFASAVRAAVAEPGPTVFIEVSPHALLASAIEDEVGACDADAVVIPSLSRGEPEWESLLTGLGTAYVHGCMPDWARLNEGGQFVPLPSYPWQRTPFWVGAPVSPVVIRLPAAATPTHSVAALTTHLTRCAAEVLGSTPGAVDPSVPLAFAGMDSLLAASFAAGWHTTSASTWRSPTCSAIAHWSTSPTSSMTGRRCASHRDLTCRQSARLVSTLGGIVGSNSRPWTIREA